MTSGDKQETGSTSKGSWAHLANGSAGGLTSALLLQPLQVIKTALQISPFSHTSASITKTKHPSIFQIIKFIKQKEGVKGFYRGLLAGCIKSTLSAGLFFYFLHISRSLYSSVLHQQSLVNFAAATTARIMQVIMVNPIVIVKTRFEVIGFNEYKGIIDAFAKIYRNEGLRSFFTNGISVALLKDVPFSAIQFPIYEKLKIGLLKAGEVYGANTTSPLIRSAIYCSSSLGAAFLSCVVTNPMDVIRTRVVFQHYNKNEQQHYSGIVDAVKKVLKHDGVQGLFYGLQARFLKKACGAMIAWTIYECLLDSQTRNRKHY